MNENLNLLEILKGCEGQKLYSPICGECVLESLNGYEGDCNEITVNFQRNGCTQWLTFGKNGRYFENGEVMLFPSKEQRDWSKFDPKGKGIPSIKDIFNNALSEKQAAERAVKKKNEQLDNECMAYTGEMADKFIDEFMFLNNFEFSLVKRLVTESNYYYNYGRKAYIVEIKRKGYYCMTLHFPHKKDGKLMTCSTYTNGYYTGTFEEFAKKLTEWFKFTE